jgi:hypothetical protein
MYRGMTQTITTKPKQNMSKTSRPLGDLGFARYRLLRLVAPVKGKQYVPVSGHF